MDSVLPPPDGERRETLETPAEPADRSSVSSPTTSTTDPSSAPTDATDVPGEGPASTAPSDLTTSMYQLLDAVVGPVPGVVGAVVSSADGFVLAARLPADSTADAASVAAMSAALLGLSNRLVQSVAPGPSRVAELRSEAAHGYVFAVAHAATLTVLATPESERPQVMAVGREITTGLLRLLRGTPDD